jgi:hypothetical protein
VDDQLDVLLHHARTERLGHFLENVAQSERRLLEFQPRISNVPQPALRVDRC